MKEYLNIKTFEVITGDIPKGIDWVEIPEGAEIYMKGNLYNFFGKHEHNVLMVTNKDGIWVNSIYKSLIKHNKTVL